MTVASQIKAELREVEQQLSRAEKYLASVEKEDAQLWREGMTTLANLERRDTESNRERHEKSLDRERQTMIRLFNAFDGVAALRKKIILLCSPEETDRRLALIDADRAALNRKRDAAAKARAARAEKLAAEKLAAEKVLTPEPPSEPTGALLPTCEKHPLYRGLRRSRFGCETCGRVYNAVQTLRETS